ncbi:MAG: DUF4920 domain-containing protein [Proteobacteria bacterium]|nr:DUF4920 domain-containing protein [Pseudomonadota bacterium]MBU1687624.1 DUF4920 domain-containing protein [Pseudomonadota bacterium]
MKKLWFIGFSLAFTLLAGTVMPALADLQLGQPLTLTEITKVSDIEKNPTAYVGKKIQISGTVVEVCSSRGCWMNLASDTPFEKFQVKVTDGVIIFPMSARGHAARAEGVVEELKLSQKEALDYYQHKAAEKRESFDPQTVTGPETIYRLRAMGAVIKD